MGTARKAKGRDHDLGLYVREEGGEDPGFSKEESPTIQKKKNLLLLLFDTFDEQFIQVGEPDSVKCYLWHLLL